MYNIFFAWVCFCFILSFLPRKNAVLSDAVFLRTAMFFTVAADFLMIILQKNAPALIFFILAQLTYTRRYSAFKTAGAVACCALGVLLSALFLSAGLLPELSLCYGVCLCSAVFLSVRAFLKNRTPENLRAACGMSLFLLCDISVAVYNMTQNTFFFKTFQCLIWVFYLPSQFLLAGSVKRTSPDL